MALLLDSEGADIPCEEDGSPMFNALLCDWNNGKGPIISVSIPYFFENSHGEYNSAGLVLAPLKDVLEEYLTEFGSVDGGDGVDDFCTYLHDYADRLRAAKVSYYA